MPAAWPAPITNGPPVDMVVEKLRTLPTPIVETPLHECERAVTISNIVHGATVTLMRSAGPNMQACFDLDSLWFGVNPPLSLGETISARQELREPAASSRAPTQRPSRCRTTRPYRWRTSCRRSAPAIPRWC